MRFFYRFLSYFGALNGAEDLRCFSASRCSKWGSASSFSCTRRCQTLAGVMMLGRSVVTFEARGRPLSLYAPIEPVWHLFLKENTMLLIQNTSRCQMGSRHALFCSSQVSSGRVQPLEGFLHLLRDAREVPSVAGRRLTRWLAILRNTSSRSKGRRIFDMPYTAKSHI